MGEKHLQWAGWTSWNTARASFSEDWDSAQLPELWWGEDRLPLARIRPLSPVEFGRHSGYFGSRNRVTFFIQIERLKGIDLSRGIYVAGSFNGWGAAIGDPRWRMRPSEMRGYEGFRLTLQKSLFGDSKPGYFKFVTGAEHWLPVPEDAPNFHYDDHGIKNYRLSARRTGKHLFQFRTPLPLAQSENRLLYYRCGERVDAVRIHPGVFLKSLHSDAQLGASASAENTTFRIFVPRAAAVYLFCFAQPEGPEGEPIAMQAGGDGVWSVTLQGDRHKWYYHYVVNEEEVEDGDPVAGKVRIPDPYALALCGPLGPGIVVDTARLRQPKFRFQPPHWHDLVILEAHVRDLTSQCPVAMSEDERLGFSGLAKWVDSELFYPQDLGVNAVELQPVHEYDAQDRHEYAWGYMPANYFSPASQYAIRPAQLSQIEEFQYLVERFHNKGIAVILDVVYNHIGEPNFFQYLDKEYYFLLGEDGHYQNFSGCGNTFDANVPMFRRLMRDSLVHWIELYDVDGFRFDLGELIGRETLAWLEGELKAVKPSIVLIAEPWSFRGHIARELRPTGFASWNDGYREFLRRYLCGEIDAAHLGYYLKGSAPDWSRFPAQTVNYVASHDDRCWIDKITENPHHDGYLPTAADRRRTHLMVSLLMLSAGIPMLAAGDDALKSKSGVNNTYQRGDLNALPYNRRAEYSATVDYFRRWIRFRHGKLGRLLRLESFPPNSYYRIRSEDALFACLINADQSRGDERLLYVINPTNGYRHVDLPDMGKARLRQLADAESWGNPYLDATAFPIAADNSRMLVPALSCGLFVLV